jgi:hypothetical protein
VTPARALFLAQRAQPIGKSLEAIANEIGVSKGAIVGYSKGNYPASVVRIEKKILATYGDGVACPHLAKNITHEQCVGFHTKAMPTSSPAAFGHWSACQRCAHNTKAKAA